MFFHFAFIAILSSLITKAFAQTCLQDINATHCLMCGSGFAVASSELIVAKSTCVAKLASAYTKTILIVVPGDANAYANVTFTQKTNNFTASILAEETEVRKYINPKLTYMFTVGSHVITADKPLVLFAGIPDLTISIISMPCFGLTTCDPTWYPTLTINTANFHFFSSKQLSFQYLQIKGSDSTTCAGTGCQSTILAENLFSDTKIIFDSVIFTAYELEQQLEASNSIIAIGKSASNITFTNVKIENCKFDSFVYQYQSPTKNLLSEYLSIYYATSTIVLSAATNSTLLLGNFLNVINHNRNIGSTSNLIKTTRNFLTQSFGFFYFKENVLSFNLSNYNQTNCLALSNLHSSIYIENSVRTDILASKILALSQIGLLYCMKCATLNINTFLVDNSKINNFAIILNSTTEIIVTKITFTTVEDTGTTIQIKDSTKATITAVSLSSTINSQIDISGANTEIILTDFNSSILKYSKTVPTFNLLNCNLILKDIKILNTDSTLTNSKMIFLSNPNKLTVQNIRIENTNYLEAFNIVSPGLAVLLDSLFIINITSMLETSYVIAYSSNILDFTLTNSLITNHSKISLYSSSGFTGKKISMENLTISNSNISNGQALLMWHLSAATTMKNCTFENLLVKELREIVQPDLDLLFFFGFATVEIFNSTFKNLGFFSWRDYYLYGGTDYSFFSFYSDSTIRFIGCLFTVDDTKLNHHFISTILASTLIEISQSTFISTKKTTATPEYRSAYGLNLNTPTLIKITNNTFENLYCFKFPDWNTQYITSYAPICVFFSSNTETIVKDKTAIFSFNNFTNLECSNYGGSLSVLNYENVTISNNNFLNSFAPQGAFLYTKAIQNLVITGNKFEDGRSNDAFVSINSVVNAQVSLNTFTDSNLKINSQNSILTLGVTNLLIKDSNFYQSRYLSQSKSAIVVDTSKLVSLINLKVNGSTTSVFQATAMYIVRCTKVELNNSLITFTENAKFYSVHSDNNQNVVIFNTTFENNYRRLLGFNDFNTIYVDSLIFTKNFESSIGESVLYFESQAIGRVDLKNMQVFSNSYKSISLMDMLTNSEFVVDNLTLNNFKGRLLYAYLYFTVPVSIINSKFVKVDFPNSMIFGVYLNLVLSNLQMEQMTFTSYAVILRSSTFDYNNISLTNVNGTEQSSTECFFEIAESTGKVHVKLLDTIAFGNLICLMQGATCTIENLNIIDTPEKNKYKFLTSDKSTLIVKNSKFYNFNETIFDLGSSSMIFDGAGFDSQTLTISPVANLKDSSQVIISSSTFKVRNLVIFYLYSTDYFKIENSNFIGTSSSFSIFEIQYCTSFNIFKSSITNYTYLAPENYSIKALMYTSDISTSYIESLNVTGNQITAVPIIHQRNSKNMTFNNSNFQSNILTKTDGSQGVSCIKVECNGAVCLTHNITNSSFVMNSAAASFPVFISDHPMNMDSVTFRDNIGFSPDFPILRLFSDNIVFNLNQESIIASGLANNIEIWIVDKDLNKNETFDSYSSATIQNFDGNVSIKENNFVSSAVKGKLIFQGLTLKALPKTYVKLKLIVNIKSSKFFDPQSVKFFSLEKVFTFYVRECIFGEIYRAGDTSCSYCPVGTFSIYDSNGLLPEFCQICPDTAACKENSTILPKNGYWKAQGNSTLIIECPFPDSCFRINGSECLFGYEGPLCQYCAVDFGKSLSSKKCIDCKANADINMGLTFIYFFLFSIYAIITTSLAIRRDESASDSVHCLLNIVVCHYQYLAIISQGLDKLKDAQDVTFNVSSNIDVLWDIINPNLCFLSFMSEYEERFQVVYMMIIAYVTFMVLLGIAITLFFVFRMAFHHSKKIILFKGSKKRFVITISLFVFNFFYPSLLSVNISKLPCLLIDNYNRLSVMKNIPKLECFGSFHIFILITMAIPGIFIFGFLVPLCLYFLLLKQRDYELSKITSLKMNTSNKSFNMKILDNAEGDAKSVNSNQDSNSHSNPPKAQNFMEKDHAEGNFLENHFKVTEFVNFIVKNRIFKFYTKGYKKEFCHWEVGKLFLKFLIAILSNLGTVIDITYIRLLLFFIFYIYAIILITKRPFKHHFCNRLELFSLSLCVSYLIFTINNLNGIEFSIFKICQVVGNSFFLFAFALSLAILGAKIAKEKYTAFYESISKTLAKKKSKRNSSKENSKVVNSTQIKIN